MKGIDVFGSLAYNKLLVSAICGWEMDWRNKMWKLQKSTSWQQFLDTHH